MLVSGCHPGDCHYLSGNYVARRRFAILKEILEFMGLEKGRVRFSWISAAEGEKFSQVIKQVTEEIRFLGPAKRLVKKVEDSRVNKEDG